MPSGKKASREARRCQARIPVKQKAGKANKTDSKKEKSRDRQDC